MKTLILTRVTALVLGAALAGVGCYASYEAAAKADGGYLILMAPLAALAAAFIPVLWERALHDRQWIRALALFIVWLPCVATVLSTAFERNHFAKAGGEAERTALRTSVERAKAERNDAKAALATATAAANKVRGLEGKACKTSCLSAKATETAAAERLTAKEAALASAESKAVTEARFKQSPWLLPLAAEGASIILIACGFGLGRSPVPVLSERQRAARRGVKTKRDNKRKIEKARKTGPKLIKPATKVAANG